MAIQSGLTTIIERATLVIPAPGIIGGYTVLIENMHEKESVYLGGDHVEPETGYELKAGIHVTIPIAPDEAVYACSNRGVEVIVCYLVTKR